jgi:pimeloyl-ACP methyl ester carboxylesterase
MPSLRFTRRALTALASGAVAVAVAGLLLIPATTANASRPDRASKPTVVLVHGAWADGSSWNGVARRLQDEGYEVLVPPNPLRGPIAGGDAAYLASYLATVPGPIVLVGHSYGGFVITNAALGNTNVKALVYVDAYIPDAHQPLGLLTANSCLNVDTSKSFRAVPLAGDADLYVQSDPNPPYTGFDECFANGVSPKDAAFLAASQRPLAASALSDPSGTPAWHTIPSWALIGTQDHVIPPRDQNDMATNAGSHIETFEAGHLGLITHPNAVVKIIDDAAAATS